MTEIDRSVFCEGCPIPINLREYRQGKSGGGLFSDARVGESACKLVEVIAGTASCTEGTFSEETHEENVKIVSCRHPLALNIIAQISDAMETPGESPEIINMLVENRGEE